MATSMSHIIDCSPEIKCSKHKKRKDEKKEAKKSLQMSIRKQREDKAKGLLFINDDETSGVNIMKPVPVNVCNLCWKILDTAKGKKNHIKDKKGPHGSKNYEFFCSNPKCGCVYSNKPDLQNHGLEKHEFI